MDVVMRNAMAVVLGRATERQNCKGRGDERVVDGRLKDSSGREVSGASVLLLTQEFGTIPDATVLVPDAIAVKLVVGSVICLPGLIRSSRRRRIRVHSGDGSRRR